MRRRLITAVLAVLVVTGCDSAADHPRDAQGTLTVFAAASLTDVFTQLGKTLETQRPGLHVRFTFAGSSALAAQIDAGAPADVFASADSAQMARVADAKLAQGTPVDFASNVLEIAVPKGNPGHVTGLADFARSELAIAVCAPQVPCGAAAERAFAAAGVTPRPDSQEEDVRAALTKVRLGEVDAALVYATDVRAGGTSVGGIPLPQADQAVNEYPVCVLKAAPNPAAARAFVDLVQSDAGQKALAAAGFRTP